GASVIRFQFDSTCIVSYRGISVVILGSGVAAVVIGSGVSGAELDGLRVVGYGARTVFLQPFGLGAVVIRGVIFWIEFARAGEISDSAIQVTVLTFFYAAINKICDRLIIPCLCRRQW